jgi:hypothetical protein
MSSCKNFVKFREENTGEMLLFKQIIKVRSFVRGAFKLVN